MNSSLRSQFLIPIVAMLLLICSAVTLVSWKIASRTTLAATEERLRNVLQLCSVSRFPLTEPVLDQIGEFSRCRIKVVPEVAATNKLFSSKESSGTFDAFAIRLDRNGNQAIAGSPSFLLALSDPKDRFALSSQAFWLPMATGILSTLAFCAMALGIANRMVRRLEKLESQVNRIASGHYETVHVEPRVQDAIASLTRSVNTMSQQLENAKEEIANSERARVIHMLANGMAHQLRNSLAGAVLLLQTLLRRKPDEAPQEIQYALQQIQLAEESIRRLLTISRHGHAAQEQVLSVEEIHKQLDCFTRPNSEHHQIHWHIECPVADRTRQIAAGNSVVSALLNLVLNAMDAAGLQGSVECRYAWDPVAGFHRWTLRDNGPGPNAKIASKMFEPFVTSKPEGIGLGLPTTALLAKELGGSLQWHRQGDWTVFELTIRDSCQREQP
ncbi:MAG: HAMP domain-containing sensor histidine kinase [Planctomycetota bacterium]|nr:HAMP domain-containing sensor histidine kinase [Planctomycetota bacterium]